MSSARTYEKVADGLRTRILTGALPEGERLPSEARLAQQLGVSRSTVREALRALLEGGYLERTSPRVVRVRPLGAGPEVFPLTEALRRQRITFEHLCEALIVLEPALIRLAATRVTPADLELLESNLEQQQEAIDDVDAFSPLDDAFHLEIAALAASPALLLARAPLSELLVPTALLVMRRPEMTAHALRYHRRMFEEIQAADPDTAAALCLRHVADFREAWVLAGFDPAAPIDEIAAGS